MGVARVVDLAFVMVLELVMKYGVGMSWWQKKWQQ